MDGDQVVTSQEGKEELLFNYFDGLLGTALPSTTTLDLSFFHREGTDLSALDVTFTEEVWDTIKALPADHHLVQTGLQEDSTKHAGRSSNQTSWPPSSRYSMEMTENYGY